MVYMMLVAHLFGDYLLQWNELARWKARSLWGVVAHGGIVTLAALACAALVVPSWWPYAIGFRERASVSWYARHLIGQRPS